MMRALLSDFLARNRPDVDKLRRQLAAFRMQPDLFGDQIAAAEQAVAQASSGFTFAQLPDVMQRDISTSRWLLEIRETDDDLQHTRDDWSDERWTARLKAVAQGLPGRFGRELAHRPARATTLETLGAVEILYPQIDTIKVPDALLGKLPNDARARAVAEWPTFLTLLCDAVRIDGGISLGEDEADEQVDFVGRWVTQGSRDYGHIRFVGDMDRARRARLAHRWLASLFDRAFDKELVAQLQQYAFFAILQNRSAP